MSIPKSISNTNTNSHKKSGFDKIGKCRKAKYCPSYEEGDVICENDAKSKKRCGIYADYK
jgi:hypothetical protein